VERKQNTSLDYLAGNWEGFYTYGPGYPVNYQTRKEKFTLTLTVHDGIVRGELVDSYIKEYFTEPATVEGTLQDQVLSLVKRYPYFLGMDENEQVFVDQSEPSHEIHYIGRLKRKLFSRKILIEGTWDISGSFLDKQGNAFYYSVDGEWEMRKIE
jgi:hypothetical protein